MKKIKIIKRTPDENKALLIEAVGGYEPYKAFYAEVGDVIISTKSTDNYNTKEESDTDFDNGKKKKWVINKFGFTVGIYNDMKRKWRILRGKMKK